MTELIWVAVISGGLGFFGSIISGVFIYKAAKAKKLGNNPHPCKDHGKWLKELDDKLEKQGNQISRIEGILNGTYRK